MKWDRGIIALVGTLLNSKAHIKPIIDGLKADMKHTTHFKLLFFLNKNCFTLPDLFN